MDGATEAELGDCEEEAEIEADETEDEGLAEIDDGELAEAVAVEAEKAVVAGRRIVENMLRMEGDEREEEADVEALAGRDGRGSKKTCVVAFVELDLVTLQSMDQVESERSGMRAEALKSSVALKSCVALRVCEELTQARPSQMASVPFESPDWPADRDEDELRLVTKHAPSKPFERLIEGPRAAASALELEVVRGSCREEGYWMRR